MMKCKVCGGNVVDFKEGYACESCGAEHEVIKSAIMPYDQENDFIGEFEITHFDLTIHEKLKQAKKILDRGDQRLIARNLDIHPNTVSLAFMGFVADEITCDRIYREALKLKA